MAEKYITVSILGKVYTFKTDEEHQFAQRASDNLVAEIERVEKLLAQESISSSQIIIIILAALNLAGENLKLKNQAIDQFNIIHYRAKEILNTLRKTGVGEIEMVDHKL